MTTRTALLIILALVVPLGPAQADGEVAALHSAWRGCLHRNFGLQSALTGRTLAADAALRSCRESESAYLTALAASPLVDGEDVARVRPALLQRARGWLLGRGASPTL
jgi:hypothetical protein